MKGRAEGVTSGLFPHPPSPRYFRCLYRLSHSHVSYLVPSPLFPLVSCRETGMSRVDERSMSGRNEGNNRLIVHSHRSLLTSVARGLSHLRFSCHSLLSPGGLDVRRDRTVREVGVVRGRLRPRPVTKVGYSPQLAGTRFLLP